MQETKFKPIFLMKEPEIKTWLILNEFNETHHDFYFKDDIAITVNFATHTFILELFDPYSRNIESCFEDVIRHLKGKI